MYSTDKKSTVGCMCNINNSNLNNVRGSACARMIKRKYISTDTE